jgi:CIC family chloride channel protein
VADVIEANALRGGRMSVGAGLAAALVSAVSLGFGASAGREGPAVHLGATFGGWIAEKLHMTRAMSRTLLGCGVAAAVAASFNAPIAGALFANEVVVGHYALRAFAPIVIASVSGTAVSRAFFGDFPAFELAPSQIESFMEIPAFAGLGIAAGRPAVLFMYGIRMVGAGFEKTPFPVWSRPALGGFAPGTRRFRARHSAVSRSAHWRSCFPRCWGSGTEPPNRRSGASFPCGFCSPWCSPRSPPRRLVWEAASAAACSAHRW